MFLRVLYTLSVIFHIGQRRAQIDRGKCNHKATDVD